MRISTPPALLQVVAGTVLTVAPARCARLAAGPTATAPEAVVRVLGARMLLQALAVRVAARRPRWRRPALEAGAVVDALHAASMVPAALRWPAYRRSAAVSAVLAGASGGLGLAASRRAPAR